jgi:hypothetical protein
MRWAEHVAHKEKRNANEIIVRKPEGKRLVWKTSAYVGEF